MKNFVLPFLLPICFLLISDQSGAQTITQQKGLTTAEFRIPQANIKVFLAEDIFPGEMNSGRIKMEILGKNARQIEKNTSEIGHYTINFNNEVFTLDNTNKALGFKVSTGKTINGLMELMNGTGVKISELNIPVKDPKNNSSIPSTCNVPSHALCGSPLRITGPFDGNLSNTNCTLEGKPMEILAESPRQCIVSYPPAITGNQSLNIREQGKSECQQSVSSVNMNISAGKLNLLKGEKTYVSVNITGLQRLPDIARLTLVNLTPEVVTMFPSNSFTKTLAPDSVGTGIYDRRFDIQSIRSGSLLP